MERTKKLKFNLLDVIIIIVAIALITGLVIRFNLADRIINSEQQARVTFLVSGIRTDTVDESLLEGDIFYCKKFNGQFGELIDRDQFKVSPAKQLLDNEQGIAVESKLDYRSDVVGYIKATGRFDDERGFLADGVNQIAPGGEYEIHSSHRSMIITVLSVDPVE